MQVDSFRVQVLQPQVDEPAQWWRPVLERSPRFTPRGHNKPLLIETICLCVNGLFALKVLTHDRQSIVKTKREFFALRDTGEAATVDVPIGVVDNTFCFLGKMITFVLTLDGPQQVQFVLRLLNRRAVPLSQPPYTVPSLRSHPFFVEVTLEERPADGGYTVLTSYSTDYRSPLLEEHLTIPVGSCLGLSLFSKLASNKVVRVAFDYEQSTCLPAWKVKMPNLSPGMFMKINGIQLAGDDLLPIKMGKELQTIIIALYAVPEEDRPIFGDVESPIIIFKMYLLPT